ncbi:hypothetical protein SAMN05421493_102142 [Pseudobutyrivibrio sp. 49]|uniref:O-antigen ligase family protein n=1 Tax=Pseudobutyrivibrio sp. 49 TaxID=1855344 RepID=UPI0008838C5E|nr:hypothetical protein [Pseudobutyrivibrio sp. 49]SDH62197.1 hypothetical protein SAMN05421493_102142 [Pseudobutyrivibrio sp. 49]
MVDVRKKTIMDYLYSPTAQRFIFALFLGMEFFYALRFGYDDIFLGHKPFFIMVLFALYYFFDPERKDNPLNISFFLLLMAYFVMGMYKFINKPIIGKDWDFTTNAWGLPMIYILGRMSVGNRKSELEKRGFLVLTTFAIGMYIQGVLNYSRILTVFGGDGMVGGTAFFDHTKLWGRNAYDVGFTVLFGGLFYAFLVRKQNKKFFIFEMIACAIGAGINLYFEGRTAVFIIVAVFMTMAFLYVMVGHHEILIKYKKVLWGILALIIVVIAAYVFNIGGFADIYNNSFMGRDGGIFGNVRLVTWKGGLIYIFKKQMGGWRLDTKKYVLDYAHNSWLEFGRNYDIVLFMFLVFFLVASIIIDFKLLYKYGKKYKIVYFAVGSKLAFFIISMMNPDCYLGMDLQYLFLFVCGIASGLYSVADASDYITLGATYSPNRYRHVIFTFSLLMFAFVGIVYTDWYVYEIKMLPAMILPAFAFLAGSMCPKGKWRNIGLVSVCGISIVIAIYMRHISKQTEYYVAGYYMDPFKKIIVEKGAYTGLWIIPIALVAGFVLYKIRFNKALTAIIPTIVTGAVFASFIKNNRIPYIKEALRLIYYTQFRLYRAWEKENKIPMQFGISWRWAHENKSGVLTSFNTWLDFDRDYGLIVFGLLLAFEIWAFVCFIKMIKNKGKQLSDYVLIVAFVLFNYHFMFEAAAYNSKYIFILGMFIYGMICKSATDEDEGPELEWKPEFLKKLKA